MCCSLQKGDVWVWGQPYRPPLLAPRPQCPRPYLLLSSCRERRSSRSCRTLSWCSASSSASLRCSPHLWPSSASASRAREQAARSASCTRASSGDREHGGATATPFSQCLLGLRLGMLVAQPYLGRGGHAGAAGSGCPRAEPGSPHSAAALALVSGHRHRWAILQRGPGAESLSPTSCRAWGKYPPHAIAPPAAPAPVQHRTTGLAGGGQAAFELLPEPVIGADGLLEALAQAADLHQVFLQQVCPCHHQGDSSGQGWLCHLPHAIPTILCRTRAISHSHSGARSPPCSPTPSQDGPVLSSMDLTCQLLARGVP